MASLVSPAEFQYDDESRGTAGLRWDVWIRDFELFTIATGVIRGPQRKATLLHVVGKACRDIYSTVADINDDYNEVKAKLGAHFAPYRNVDFEIFKFGQLKQRDTESLDDFMFRLRAAASRCDFVDINPELRRQLVAGCKSTSLKEHILNTPGITLIQITQRARTEEAATAHMQVLKGQCQVKIEPVAAITSQFNQNRQTTREHDQAYRRNFNKPMYKKENKPNGKCFSCGYEYPHKGQCPAKNNKCNVCNEYGHFAVSRFCKKKISVVNECKQDQEDKEYTFAVHSQCKSRPTIKISICDTFVEVLIALKIKFNFNI